MRTLSNNETNNVTGADYSEDIVTAAASIYVGSAIGNAASAISSATFAGAANLLGTASALAPLTFALRAVGAVVSPVMYFAAPLFVFNAVYPGVMEEKVSQTLFGRC